MASIAASSANAQDGQTVRRVFVADHAAPIVTAINIDAPGNRWIFETEVPARLYPTGLSELVAVLDFLATVLNLT